MRRHKRDPDDFQWTHDGLDVASSLPPESAFIDPAGHPGSRLLLFLSVVSSLGVLAIVLMIAIYSLNVGTIWSAHSAAVSPALEGRPIVIRNGGSLAVTIFYQDTRGAESLVGSILPHQASKLRIRVRCLDGVLTARSGSRIVAKSGSLCAGQAWTIKPGG